MQLLWFKRDLRLHDHLALHSACAQGPVLPLYVIEPEYWQQPDTSWRQWAFIAEALLELDADLRARGQGLLLQRGDMLSVLERLHRRFAFTALHAHEETGNHWTWQRDKAVARWCQAHGVTFIEHRQFGVFRPLADRNRWATQWETLMARPCLPPPQHLQPVCPTAPLPADLPAQPYGHDLTPCPRRQPGGRRSGVRLLVSFLGERGRLYHGSRGAPDAASQHGARLSAHLAYGCLSLREVVQAARRVRQQAKDPRWVRSLDAFLSRLYWHCHFIQKLEDQPDIEWCNLQRSLDGLREDPPDPQRLQAWCEGRTGYPLVDACMRSLQATGWLNFRMRALLMSFASYLLHLHWLQPGRYLARLFTDYEPGIHWSQVQMQSGTTGINAWRIYNPLRQSLAHDPHGHFIRRWVPELRRVPQAWIHEPWKMPRDLQVQHACLIGDDYPAPLIDHQQAARQARRALREHLSTHMTQAREERQQIRQRHASRRRPSRAGQLRDDRQLQLDL